MIKLSKLLIVTTHSIQFLRGYKMQVRIASQSNYTTLELIANEILAPLYGDQTKYLNQWLTGDGFKHAFLFFDEENKPVGFLNLKRKPDKSYVKIATLIVLPTHQGRGYEAKLLNFAQKHAMEWYFECMVVTVSEEKPESLSFFLKNRFRIPGLKLTNLVNLKTLDFTIFNKIQKLVK
jgi:ribosomal protein S18 acetylase RimI-like enzyme